MEVTCRRVFSIQYWYVICASLACLCSVYDFDVYRIICYVYTRAKTVVKTVYDNSKCFVVQVGMHQGLALSPLSFVIVGSAESVGVEMRERKMQEHSFLCSLFPLRNTSGIWKMGSCALWRHASIGLHIMLSQHVLSFLYIYSEHSLLKLALWSNFNLSMWTTTNLVYTKCIVYRPTDAQQ